TSFDEVADKRPGSARQIEEFRGRESAVIIAACNEDLAVGRQRRCRAKASSVKTTGRRPDPARWVVEFRARGIRIAAACDKHLAIGQQGHSVPKACGVETARRTPGSARRIVEFRARESDAVVVVSACDEHLTAKQRRRRVMRSSGEETAGG